MASFAPAWWSFWAMPQEMERLLASPKTTATRPSRLSMGRESSKRLRIAAETGHRAQRPGCRELPGSKICYESIMPSIHKVSIALTGEQIDALKAVVEAGEYATTSEVVREAIRDWQYKRELRQEDVRHLRQLWDE